MNTLYKTATIRHFHNSRSAGAVSYPDKCSEVLDNEIIEAAGGELEQWNGYAVTPLHSLDALASELGVARIDYKDESSRFGLGSFKALGGAYATLSLLQREISKQVGRDISMADIRSGRFREQAAKITVTTATDGNHGRSVAWGSQQFGCRCVIYIHAEVSAGRQAAMESFGAEVIRIDGNYDESVHRAAKDAEANGWFVVSDTSYEGYTQVPREVMAGYTLMAAEALEQLSAKELPTHVFVQGGVGGLAAAVCGYTWSRLGAKRPRFIIVEPEWADCLFQSAVNNAPTTVHINQETIMAGLSCGEVSTLAWTILDTGADDFLTMPDSIVAPTMRLLADCTPSIEGGESGVAGLAVLISVLEQQDLVETLGLNSDSRVLVFGTEGATDPDIYRELVGLKPISIET